MHPLIMIIITNNNKYILSVSQVKDMEQGDMGI